MDEKKQSIFEKKIQPLLEYVGAIGASFMVVAYIITVFILINGFSAHRLFQTTIFAFVNALVGFIIMQFLKIQGISFAENIPENKKVIEQYYLTKTKDKKPHSIKYYWLVSVIKDIFTKVLTLAITTIGMIYIVIEGSNDWNMLSIALVNLIMFICFGFLSLNRAYNFYNNEHIPYMKGEIEKSIKTVDNNKSIGV